MIELESVIIKSVIEILSDFFTGIVISLIIFLIAVILKLWKQYDYL